MKHFLDTGASTSSYHYTSFYGTSSAFTYITYLGCSGSENKLIDCSYSNIAPINCGLGEHAGVRCVGKQCMT